MYVASRKSLIYHANNMRLPNGFNWRKCHKCHHYAVEIFSKEFGSIKGHFCPHAVEMELELEKGRPCETYSERKNDGLPYLRKIVPQVIDADNCFYDGMH